MISNSAPHWLPFLALIARRSKETVRALFDQVVNKQMRLVLVWDDDSKRASALVGVRTHMRGDDMIGELLWMAGYGRKDREYLLPELETCCKLDVSSAGRCAGRAGRGDAQRHGYKMTHIQMEKSLAEKRPWAADHKHQSPNRRR